MSGACRSGAPRPGSAPENARTARFRGDTGVTGWPGWPGAPRLSTGAATHNLRRLPWGTPPSAPAPGRPGTPETRNRACRHCPPTCRLWHRQPIRRYIPGMAPKRLPKGENTAGLNPDGTLAIGTPDEMRPLLEQWKRWQEMYARGEWPDEPIARSSRLWREVTSPARCTCAARKRNHEGYRDHHDGVCHLQSVGTR